MSVWYQAVSTPIWWSCTQSRSTMTMSLRTCVVSWQIGCFYSSLVERTGQLRDSTWTVLVRGASHTSSIVSNIKVIYLAVSISNYTEMYRNEWMLICHRLSPTFLFPKGRRMHCTLPPLTVTTCVGSSSSKNLRSWEITTTDPSNFLRAAVSTCWKNLQSYGMCVVWCVCFVC